MTWEPAFAKELEWILADTLKRHFTGENFDREAATIRCVTKGLVQKDFLGNLKLQKRFEGTEDNQILEIIRQDVLQGGYALIHYEGFEDYTPGDNVLHLFAMGALGAEAIKASRELREKGIYANVFIVTSPDLLLGNFAFNDQFTHLTKGLGVSGDLHLNPTKGHTIESAGQWYSLQAARVPILSVHDGEPGLLDNIGSIVGVKHRTQAIRKTSKSGTTTDIFHYHHIDSEGIVAAAEEILKETAAEVFRVNPAVLSTINT